MVYIYIAPNYGTEGELLSESKHRVFLCKLLRPYPANSFDFDHVCFVSIVLVFNLCVWWWVSVLC